VWWPDSYTAPRTGHAHGWVSLLAKALLGAGNPTHSIHGNCHRRNIDATVAIQKIENFVLGLPSLLPLELDLIATAKTAPSNLP
jgi:hypothetical protein